MVAFEGGWMIEGAQSRKAEEICLLMLTFERDDIFWLVLNEIGGLFHLNMGRCGCV